MQNDGFDEDLDLAAPGDELDDPDGLDEDEGISDAAAAAAGSAGSDELAPVDSEAQAIADELADQNRQLQEENSRLQKQRAEESKRSAKEESDTLAGRAKDLAARRRKAWEEDDLDAATDLDEDLFQVRIRRAELQRQSEAPPPEDSPAAGTGDPDADLGDLAPAAASWIKRNRSWFAPESADYDETRQKKAIALARDLEKDYVVSDPELYRQIDKRMKQTPSRRMSGRGQVAGVQRGDVSGTGRRSGRVPPAEERRSMHTYGLNHQNKRDLDAWNRRDDPL